MYSRLVGQTLRKKSLGLPLGIGRLRQTCRVAFLPVGPATTFRDVVSELSRMKGHLAYIPCKYDWLMVERNGKGSQKSSVLIVENIIKMTSLQPPAPSPNTAFQTFSA